MVLTGPTRGTRQRSSDFGKSFCRTERFGKIFGLIVPSDGYVSTKPSRAAERDGENELMPRPPA